MNNFINDLQVGGTIAILTLTQAVAFSTILSHVPAYFGLYSAINNCNSQSQSGFLWWA
jgi:MFS superfamily sulfate permease-like transporter